MNLSYAVRTKIAFILDWVCQRLIRPNPARLCYFSMPDYSDNAYYVYRHALITRSNLEHVWLIEDSACRNRIRVEFDEIARQRGQRGNSLRVVAKKTLTGYWAYLTAKYLFHTHGGYTFSSGVTKRHIVNLFHGMPIKAIGRLDRSSPDAVPAFGTLHIATSTLFRYIVALSFGVPVEKVLLCAMPRCDAFLSSGVDARPKLDALLRSEGQNIVLWLPTFRSMSRKGVAVVDKSSFLDDVDPDTMRELDQQAGKTNSLVVVKLHPYDALNHEQTAMTCRNIRFLKSSEWIASGIQLYDLAACADGLMSDVSSILIDFLATGKPAGIIGFNPTSYSRELTIPIEQLLEGDCYSDLRRASAIESFFLAVSRQTPEPNADGGLRKMLYERVGECGSESVLNAVGLTNF